MIYMQRIKEISALNLDICNTAASQTLEDKDLLAEVMDDYNKTFFRTQSGKCIHELTIVVIASIKPEQD